MGGWGTLRAAQELRGAGAVEAVDWQAPVLRGAVREGGETYRPELDLRSLAFVRNRCPCGDGRAARVCRHALALLLEARARAQTAPPPVRPGERPGLLPDTWMVVDGSPHYLAILLRDRGDPRYKRCTEWLRAEGFTPEASNGKWWLRDSHKVLNFLARQQQRLEAEFAPGYTDNYRRRMAGVQPARLRCAARPQAGGFVLSMGLDAGGLDPAEVRRALATGRQYVVAGDRVHLLGADVLARLEAAQRSLGGAPDLPCSGALELHLAGADLAHADAVLADLDIEADLPEDWRRRSAAIREVGRLQPPPLPEAVAARLRPYQLLGVAWLWHLWRNRLGGVLADEMGLGKTIQAIGLILCAKGEGGAREPALVVAPASLLGNWERELGAWAPGLRVYRHHGPARLRAPWEAQDAPDVCLTSYSTLRNDRELFAAAAFCLAVADEAQHVKNRRTDAARSLRAVKAPARFVLTGTPIENSPDDLRALFEFCLPGYLKRPPGARATDRQWQDRHDLERAAPYILRRSKALVAPELPEKIEQTLWCPLEPRQQALYASVREAGERELLRLAASGASEGRLRFTLLTELLRLRQVCADPGLLDPDCPLDESAKFILFRELLAEALDGGHRLLVFSQFVALLHRLRDWFGQEGIPVAYLDGATRDRLAVCDRFNRDPAIPVCLVSLKAGGTGLNLTGADTVVHFDPWWNPAVEDQAVGRAHRIGQARTVTSYKLVAEGTIEDKVLALQTRKAAWLRDLLDESARATAKVDLSTLRDLLS